jgi:hypothetical protein
MRIHSCPDRLVKIAMCTFALGLGLALGPSARAALVTWNLNPNDLNQSLGAASQTFTSNSASITAYGFDHVAGPDTPHTLYYRDEGPGGDHGLGLEGTAHNELQVNPNGSPAQYIQFDLTSILSQGFTGGKVKVSSVDAPTNEVFDIYGSNTLGALGTKISIAGGYGSADNNIFVNIPNFGSYEFISIVAAIGDVLPWSLQASMPAVPEIGGATAAFALLAFFGLVIASHSIRARPNS